MCIRDSDDYIGGPALKISIFLSLFNVHMNRVPIAGQVDFVRYQEGQFLPAFKNHASEVNERNYVGMTVADGCLLYTSRCV